MSLLATLHRAGRELLDLLLPPACPLCRILLAPGAPAGFCATCRAQLPPLLPPRCSRCALPFAAQSGAEHLCAECLGEARPPFATVAAGGLYDGLLRSAIGRYKYAGAVHLDRPLADLVLDQATLPEVDLLLPVPLHPKRLRQRTYNQSLLLARRLAARMALPVATDLLQRVRPTPPQRGLAAEIRRRNLRGAFALLSPLDGERVLLVDDVMTTGSTARECARVLREGGASRVDVAIVARAGLLRAPCQSLHQC